MTPLSSIKISLSAALGLALLTGSLRADVRLPAIFSDHMVLKRSAKVPLWGQADPGLPHPRRWTIASPSTSGGFSAAGYYFAKRLQSELEGFAICGEDKKWGWARAMIDGDTVIVWSEKIPSPVAVRYAWADNPPGNLYNGAGLPASPFRTDDFPLTTLNVKY